MQQFLAVVLPTAQCEEEPLSTYPAVISLIHRTLLDSLLTMIYVIHDEMKSLDASRLVLGSINWPRYLVIWLLTRPQSSPESDLVCPLPYRSLGYSSFGGYVTGGLQPLQLLLASTRRNQHTAITHMTRL